MLEQKPKLLAREEDILQLYPRPPIITSLQTGWQGFGLAYMCQPPGEVPEVSTPRWHSVGIFTYGNRVIHADRKIDGRKQRDAVVGGDIIITPANIGHQAAWEEEGDFIILGIEPQFFAEKSVIKATEEVIYQDRGMLESLYPRFEAKIRLENEEPIHWVRKHYDSWNKNN